MGGSENDKALWVSDLHKFPLQIDTFFFTNLHVIGVVEVEEVAVELGLLPPVGLLAGIFRLKLEREKEVGILAGRQVADLYAANCIFNGSIKRGGTSQKFINSQ